MPPVLTPGQEPVPLLVIAEYTLFPGTLVPFHVHERGLCDAVAHSLATDRRIVVMSAPRASETVRVVGAIGRIVSDRRYEDGRIDIFVHGLERVSALCPPGPDPRFSVELRIEPDEVRESARVAAERLRLLAIAFARGLRQSGADDEAEAVLAATGSTTDPGLLSHRLAAFVFQKPLDRQRFLETRCPVRRCDGLVDAIGRSLLQLNTAARTLH
jgi:Lon protease-like protein